MYICIYILRIIIIIINDKPLKGYKGYKGCAAGREEDDEKMML